MECVGANTLAAFVDGALDAPEATRVEGHVDHCDDCRRALAALAKGTDPSTPLRAGSHIDALATEQGPALPFDASAQPTLAFRELPAIAERYEMLGVLGQGAMGVVYLARDVGLGRRVALKVVRPDATGRASASERRARLLREAQAMARLAHPNVAAVYHADAVDDQVFLVIEYVAGVTLARWLEAEPRSWRAVVDLLIQAGRGLAAAHAAGVVHRDFKPSNVLVGDDGRVRVADFGLAREVDASPAPTAPIDGSVSSDAPTMTRTGALVGTPAYMAPEQLRGTTADAATDQFAFGVTLYEALYGKRPFSGENVAALAAAIAAGAPIAATSRRVPARVERIVRRALAVEPTARFPTMAAVVRALERARRARWPIAAGAGALGVAAAAVLIAGSAPAPCGGGAARLNGVWDPVISARAERAFAATRLPYGGPAWKTTRERLDRYSRRWRDAHREACEATRVRGEHSELVLDRRMLCLEERLGELRTLGQALAAADGDVVRRAARAAGALAPIDTCADLAAVMGRVKPPADPAQRSAVVALRDELSAARVARQLGRYRDGPAVVTPLVEKARAIGYAPAVAEALLELGRARTEVDDASGAVGALEEAAKTAYGAGDDETAAVAWTALVYAAGYQRHDARAGAAAAELARAALTRSPGSDGGRAQLLSYEGATRFAAGDYPSALGKHEEALALATRALPAGADELATIRNNLANAHNALGHRGEAIRLLREAIAIRTANLGRDHPDTAENVGNLALVLADDGKPAEALVEFDAAIAALEKSVGAHHATVATALVNSANALEAMGRTEDALARARRAADIFARYEDRSVLATARTQVARLLASSGKSDEAIALFTSALALQEAELGVTHPKLATTLNNLAQVHVDKQEFSAAIPLYERALGIAEAALGKTHPRIAYSVLGLGQAYLGAHQPRRALAPLRRGIAIFEAAGASAADLAEARTLLARAEREAR